MPRKQVLDKDDGVRGQGSVIGKVGKVDRGVTESFSLMQLGQKLGHHFGRLERLAGDDDSKVENSGQ